MSKSKREKRQTKAQLHQQRQQLQRVVKAEQAERLRQWERDALEYRWQHSFDQMKTFPNEGLANIYTCEQCGLVIWTVDMIKGITPFVTACRREELRGDACGGSMQSGMYRVAMITLLPDYVWYRPSLAELSTLSPATMEHVNRGGLILARVQPRPVPPVEVG